MRKQCVQGIHSHVDAKGKTRRETKNGDDVEVEKRQDERKTAFT